MLGMARALKTFTTSAGFFDLAVAAPSMKAALEAWGAESNLFQQGFARQSTDRAIVAATQAKPGVVLKRAVGTHDPFSEHAALPTRLVKAEGANGKSEPAKQARPTVKPPRPVHDGKHADTARALARAEKQRQRTAQREEAAQAKEHVRRERAVARAQAALEEAEVAHRKEVEKIDDARRTLEAKAEAEEARWNKRRKELNGAVRRAQGS